LWKYKDIDIAQYTLISDDKNKDLLVMGSTSSIIIPQNTFSKGDQIKFTCNKAGGYLLLAEGDSSETVFVSVFDWGILTSQDFPAGADEMELRSNSVITLKCKGNDEFVITGDYTKNSFRVYDDAGNERTVTIVGNSFNISSL